MYRYCSLLFLAGFVVLSWTHARGQRVLHYLNLDPDGARAQQTGQSWPRHAAARPQPCPRAILRASSGAMLRASIAKKAASGGKPVLTPADATGSAPAVRESASFSAHHGNLWRPEFSEAARGIRTAVDAAETRDDFMAVLRQFQWELSEIRLPAEAHAVKKEQAKKDITRERLNINGREVDGRAFLEELVWETCGLCTCARPPPCSTLCPCHCTLCREQLTQISHAPH
jgi:hypothetical protein